ncbi:hypothetical protein DYB28_005678 [Aphanomyces astaci]|uniref:Histidine ammonia-lyase n=1 Tax=Aphanomyces astaci TaxID=112090 RepID=A0A397AQP4_APHAT|nr:hypothetical protein DYB36_001096 [Aphanomyces astaci]RHY50318.1 hypothetical protein DYB34_002307 [Aphanomyces astaci]RHY59568.1 hypothetical protein DYB30_000986 [Aphanomyces astaci]RHY69481.1 hypothetical protein DYB38_001731 [Aphanomyces astaci]RHZ00237.1 hypothetical protein DYB31_007111 [Aphanomyces astaci]
MSKRSAVVLDGCSLQTDDLVLLSKGQTKLELSTEAWAKVKSSREVVDNILREKKVAYGINTGFGLFSMNLNI